MNNKEPVLLLEEVYKGFQSADAFELFLREISLSLMQGESIAITGASGSGKTTLLNMAGGLLKPDQGKVFIVGKDPFSYIGSSIRNRHVGSVFQSFHLLDDYDVMGNVIFPALVGRHSMKAKAALYHKAESLLDQVGMKHRIRSTCHNLSGGEKQRIAIARALINNPELILADEPSGSLDRKNAQNIHSLLLDLAKSNRHALLIVTHNLELASLCDRCYRLENGKLLA